VIPVAYNNIKQERFAEKKVLVDRILRRIISIVYFKIKRVIVGPLKMLNLRT